ncbi:hypothetical protein GQ42DRAFT_181642 [Ramicandelaber brevisporus]|nr:hypothetical protein GQ42DRAFT_181642 [Ramicandelaber brevisporus]
MNQTELPLRPVFSGKRLRYGSLTTESSSNGSNTSGVPVLPVEVVHEIMLHVYRDERSKLSSVCKQWRVAYMLFCAYNDFDIIYVLKSGAKKRVVLTNIREFGYRIRTMRVTTTFLREMVDLEPNFVTFIPNVIEISIALSDTTPSGLWVSGVLGQLPHLTAINIYSRYWDLDSDFVDVFNDALPRMPQVDCIAFENLTLPPSFLSSSSLIAIAPDIYNLRLSVSQFTASDITSIAELFPNLVELGFYMVESMEVLLAISNLFANKRIFPELTGITLEIAFDLSRTAAIFDDGIGAKVTAYDLVMRIVECDREDYELYLGFLLGACSTTDAQLIERERLFLIEFGHKVANTLHQFAMTHVTPASGEYDPVTTLFNHSASRFPFLGNLDLYLAPTTHTMDKIIGVLNNKFLLPHLDTAWFFLDGSQDEAFTEDHVKSILTRPLDVFFVDQNEMDKERNENEMGIQQVTKFLPDVDEDALL